MWAVIVTLDQATVDHLDWMREHHGVTKSAAIRLSVEERYNRLHPAVTAPAAMRAIYGDR